MSDRHTLLWRSSLAQHAAHTGSLPPPITREFIPSPLGNLELLSAQPQNSSSPRKKALFFLHGGFGSASVWIPFMTYFSARGYPCYAGSLRGHGSSWIPGYFQMVWRYGKGSMTQDLATALEYVRNFESKKRGRNMENEDLVLVGHSSGGGLSQLYLSRSMGQVGALVLLASAPNFGLLDVYRNWFKLDPWFPARYYVRDLWHPRSPLSSTTLVHKAFFSREFPTVEVKKFERLLPEYESMAWPIGMMVSFINVSNVLKNIVGWKSESRDRVLVIAGENDKLMGVTLMQRMAAAYRQAFVKSIRGLLFKDSESKIETVAKQESSDGVAFDVVDGSGHHIQNDLYGEDAAKKIVEFVEQL